MEVSIHGAKARRAGLLVRVESGEKITIARAGLPVARLVPIREHKEKRIAGQAKGKIIIHDDFDALLPPEIVAGSDRWNAKY